MKKGLLKEALIKYVSGLILVGLLVFVPAWTLKWSHGWLFMALLFIPMFFAGILMYYKDPALLESRLKAKETQKEQKDVINYSGIMFMAAFILAGLNYRFGWTVLTLTVLNCVLQKNGVHNLESVRAYLEMAAEIGAANVSLIGMFLANDYCRENYISPEILDFSGDCRFSIWNHFHDHDYCQCSSGDYKAEAGYVRYYYRCPGNVAKPDYCRQLVYGTDNQLRAGFGDAPTIEL